MYIAKMCNIQKIIYQCVGNVMFFEINPTCRSKNASIKTLHCNKVLILQTNSNCLSVNQEMVNNFYRYNNSFDTTV